MRDVRQMPGALERPGAYNDSINTRESLYNWFLEDQRAQVPAWNHTHVGCFNGVVAHKTGNTPPAWCRKPECGQPDKMHHESSHSFEAVVRRRGWPWQLAAAS